jgi:hypothetical protein
MCQGRPDVLVSLQAALQLLHESPMSLLCHLTLQLAAAISGLASMHAGGRILRGQSSESCRAKKSPRFLRASGIARFRTSCRRIFQKGCASIYLQCFLKSSSKLLKSALGSRHLSVRREKAGACPVPRRSLEEAGAFCAPCRAVLGFGRDPSPLSLAFHPPLRNPSLVQ